MKTVMLTTFSEDYKVHMLQEMLKDAGIESMTQSELSHQVMSPLYGIGIDVLVFEKDLERAKAILKEAFPENY